MTDIADFDARQRFARELDRNFSVIASAGSGKTRAITDRVVEIATSPNGLEHLPKLVVVTYTNRAADEMQQRARQQILEANLSLSVIEAFNRAFFGTIHAFCMKLLARHGHHLGLSANLELITDDDDLWSQFVQQYTVIGRSLTEENRHALMRHVQARQLMELGRKSDIELAAEQPQTPCPDLNFRAVYGVPARGGTNIAKAQIELERWEERWRKGADFAPWPACATTSQDFVPLWRAAFRPLREWVNACAMCAAAEVQRDYREFRLERGLVTYRDQVALAAELMRLPDVAARVREKEYRVILDEAQDTEPQQFFVLLEVARESADGADAPQSLLKIANSADGNLRPGHFCMVGDFQQSIYRDPADLAHYRELHKSLVATGGVEELKFSVTFRLDTAQLDFVNETFAEILTKTEGQVEFVELSPRPDVLPGQVIRFDFNCDVDPKWPEARLAAVEARELAAWLSKIGLEKLRATCWREVAILCPRKAWLRPLRDALLDVSLPVEVQSEADLEAENPAYAWLTALLAIMVDPNASYEIVGVLREIFGLTDDELARFSQGFGGRFQIAERTAGRGTVANTLNQLARIRAAIVQQPLFSAVQEIVRTTQLRERLRSLPADEFGDLKSEIDNLLSNAAAAEARGFALPDFAELMRTKFHATRETQPSPADAIQLITSHKAKGSEWQAVVVPFLTREVRDAPPRYPYVIKDIETGGAQILFDRTDFNEFEETLERAARQEMERLLYVALTRARHTLVLAFDRQFFQKANGEFHSHSQIRWLKAVNGECNCEVVTSLSNEPFGCRDTAEHQRRATRESVHDDLSELELGWIDNARRRAADFIHTISPSKFAPEEKTEPTKNEDVWTELEPELRPPRIKNPATRYGVWWHELAQQIPWGSGLDAWQRVFEGCLSISPDPARSKREWKLLREYVSKHQDLFAGNASPEMPFFWRLDERRCLEGIVDLALVEPGEKKWFILDWKTTRDKIDILRVRYRPQLAAYWKAISDMTSANVQTGIYSTATGELVIYDDDELTREWGRLQRLPPDELTGEIAPA